MAWVGAHRAYLSTTELPSLLGMEFFDRDEHPSGDGSSLDMSGLALMLIIGDMAPRLFGEAGSLEKLVKKLHGHGR